MENNLIKLRITQIKQNKNNGFTLVELIVVIIIIAILAAIAIPALSGYINKAKQSSIINECRQAVIAAKTVAAEASITNRGKLNGNPDDTIKQEIIDLSEIPSTGVIDRVLYAESNVTELQYTNSGLTALYKNGEYKIIEPDNLTAGSPSAGASASPPSADSYNFTNVKDIADYDKKQLAIKENAKEVVRLAEAAMLESLNEYGGMYYTSSIGNAVTRSVNPNTLENAFLVNIFDSGGNQIFTGVQSNFDKIFVNKINASNSNIGYTKVTFNIEATVSSTSGKKIYTNKVSQVSFKSNMMTGSTQNADNYTYVVATDTLLNTPG